MVERPQKPPERASGFRVRVWKLLYCLWCRVWGSSVNCTASKCFTIPQSTYFHTLSESSRPQKEQMYILGGTHPVIVMILGSSIYSYSTNFTAWWVHLMHIGTLLPFLNPFLPTLVLALDPRKHTKTQTIPFLALQKKTCLGYICVYIYIREI